VLVDWKFQDTTDAEMEARALVRECLPRAPIVLATEDAFGLLNSDSTKALFLMSSVSRAVPRDRTR